MLTLTRAAEIWLDAEAGLALAAAPEAVAPPVCDGTAADAASRGEETVPGDTVVPGCPVVPAAPGADAALPAAAEDGFAWAGSACPGVAAASAI